MAYNIIFDSVSINAVHLYLSVSRSIDSGPAFSTRENLVPRFPVPRFPPPYFSWSPVFHSRVFSVPIGSQCKNIPKKAYTSKSINAKNLKDTLLARNLALIVNLIQTDKTVN